MKNPNSFDPTKTYRIIEIPQPTDAEIAELRQAAGIVESIQFHRSGAQRTADAYYGGSHKVERHPDIEGSAAIFTDGSPVPDFFN